MCSKTEFYGSAAALAEGIAEREAALALRLAGEQHLARDLERGVLEVAAADGAARFGGAHPHARAGLARRRAAGLDHGDLNDAGHGWPSGCSRELRELRAAPGREKRASRR